MSAWLVRGVLLALLGAPGAALAQASAPPGAAPETAPVAAVVGVYTPSVYFGDSMARGRHAETIARALEAATGLTIRGRAFGAAGEFQAQVAAGAVDFAVIDAIYALEHAAMKPLAQAQSGGNPARPLIVLAGSDAKNIAALAGQSLVLFEVGGREDRFVSNFVFQGQLGPDYFKRAKSVRDAAAALAMVKLSKAQVTVSYQGAAGNLFPVYTSRAAPLPIFVQAREGVDPATLAAVKKAVVGLQASTEAFDSFGPFNPASAALSALRSALASAPGGALTDPILATATGALPPPRSFLEATVPAALIQDPPPGDVVIVPAPPVDSF